MSAGPRPAGVAKLWTAPVAALTWRSAKQAANFLAGVPHRRSAFGLIGGGFAVASDGRQATIAETRPRHTSARRPRRATAIDIENLPRTPSARTRRAPRAPGVQVSVSDRACFAQVPRGQTSGQTAGGGGIRMSRN